MINKDNVIFVTEYDGRKKELSKTGMRRKLFIGFIVIIFIALILSDSIGVTATIGVPGLFLSIPMLLVVVGCTYNFKFHEENHKVEIKDGGEIIGNERFIPKGIQTWKDIRRSLLAPFRKNMIVLSTCLLMDLIWLYHIYVEYGQASLIVSMIFHVIFIVGQVLLIYDFSSTDLATIKKIGDIIEDKKLNENRTCVGFREEVEGSVRMVIITIYKRKKK